MRSYTLLGFALLLLVLNILLSDVLKGKGAKLREEHLLLNRGTLIIFPRDLHFAMADTGFINTLSFIGYTLEKNNRKIPKEDGYRIYTSLDAVTLYNPRYFDPYYVANAFLTWDVGLYKEAISILERGMEYVEDWRIPFYIGFIYFYFLDDNIKGAEYLRKASKYKSAGEYNLLPLLASRLYYEEGKTELAILVLKEQLKVMRDEKMKEAIKARLKTLENALRIRMAIKEFRRKHGRNPRSIEELVKEGLIPANLRDSAGGRFYLTEEGKIRSEKVLYPVKRGKRR